MYKYITGSIFLIITSLFIPYYMQAQTINIATYNIRFDNPDDKGNLWEDRKKPLVHLIQFHNISLFGTQEGKHHQLEDIKQGLEQFDYVGDGREDGKRGGEFSAIFYDTRKFNVKESATFWLSNDPDEPSVGWDAAMERICTWALFEDKSTNHTYYVFNVHYDHVGQEAREQSSVLLLEKIPEINKSNLPAIWMGDFNITRDNKAYSIILDSKLWKDAYDISQLPPYGPEGTFNAFQFDRAPDQHIDHVFVQGDINILRYGILTDNYGLKYPSDHFPVMVTLEWLSEQ